MSGTGDRILSLATDAKDAFFEEIKEKQQWISLVEFLKQKGDEHNLTGDERERFLIEARILIETELAVQEIAPGLKLGVMIELEEEEAREMRESFVPPTVIPQTAAFERIKKKRKKE